MAQFGDVVQEFASRGLIHDSTDRAELTKRSTSSQMSAYVGFDPTSDSLHVGNLLGQISLRRFQMLGHRPVVLAGGATGMVGDPSGRSEERNLLDADSLAQNVSCIKGQLERILDFDSGANKAVLVDNATWTKDVPVLDFLRDVGKYITVNQMMAKESVKNRLTSENGLSYTEFSYMLLQANDFRHLCEFENVEMQMGGSDQWGNITAGTDLIRRRLGTSGYGLTWPLLTRSDGQKMGKSVHGALWLDPEKTSPYEFRQYWVQLPDEDVERFLLQLTLRSVEDIHALMSEHRAAPEKRLAQRALATDVTTLVHGAAAEQAAALSEALSRLGAEPVVVPTIAIVPPQSFAELDQAIARLDQTDYLLLTSVNAVNAFFDRLVAQGRSPQALSGIQTVAVGPKSAEALAERGVTADLIPQDYRAEGVVALLKDRVSGKRLLYPKAALARDLIPTELTAAGAKVIAPVAYASAPPVDAAKKLQQALAEGLDLLTFTASSTVQNFVDLLDDQDLVLAKRIPVASIGPLTSATRGEPGSNVIIEPDNSTLETLVTAIKTYFSGTR